MRRDCIRNGKARLPCILFKYLAERIIIIGSAISYHFSFVFHYLGLGRLYLVQKIKGRREAGMI